MQKNILTITIDKPINKVFGFTTNPQNTHLWIDSIEEEISSEYPPRIGTEYKNQGNNNDWDCCKVIEIEQDKLFTLSDLKNNYHVQYSYKKIDDKKTYE